MAILNPENSFPSEQEIETMFQELKVDSYPLENSAIEHLLRVFRKIYVNGGAEFVRFKLSHHPVLDRLYYHHQLNKINFLERFLKMDRTQAILSSIDESMGLKFPIHLQDDSSAFTLDGELAKTLFRGGVYQKFGGTPQEAKIIGVNFCQALFGDRYNDISLYTCYEPWSNWFGGVAWDLTWWGIDRPHKILWMLCVTDSD